MLQDEAEEQDEAKAEVGRCLHHSSQHILLGCAKLAVNATACCDLLVNCLSDAQHRPDAECIVLMLLSVSIQLKTSDLHRG